MFVIYIIINICVNLIIYLLDQECLFIDDLQYKYYHVNI